MFTFFKIQTISSRLIMACCLLQLCCFNLLRAQQLFRLKQTYRLRVDLAETFVGSAQENLYYYTGTQKFKKTGRIEVFDLLHNKHRKPLQFQKHLLPFSLIAFSIGKNHAALLAFDSVYIYLRQAQRFTFAYAIPNTAAFEKVFCIQDSVLLLQKLYDYHPQDMPQCCGFTYWNLNQNQELQTQHFAYAGIPYSHLVHHWFEVKGQWLLLTNIATNTLTFYKGNQIDSLPLPILLPAFQNTDSAFFALRLLLGVKPAISQLYASDSVQHRIEKVFWMKDSLILVSMVFPGAGKGARKIIYCWLTANGWQFKTYTYVMVPYIDELLANEQFPLYLVFSSPMFYGAGHFYMVSDYIPYLQKAGRARQCYGLFKYTFHE